MNKLFRPLIKKSYSYNHINRIFGYFYDFNHLFGINYFAIIAIYFVLYFFEKIFNEVAKFITLSHDHVTLQVLLSLFNIYSTETLLSVIISYHYRYRMNLKKYIQRKNPLYTYATRNAF